MIKCGGVVEGLKLSCAAVLCFASRIYFFAHTNTNWSYSIHSASLRFQTLLSDLVFQSLSLIPFVSENFLVSLI
ncbi:hypothetical protein O6P43_008553 [Quillaja saponaria]|uniref:Uncharacterized protein n=1 Tax=Quillaja saponaria TaxID=32244 RepID=A0AAD7M5X9_QUISA|nr:hypothetical protein O6P43_008553 [Quillaja saponaria]